MTRILPLFLSIFLAATSAFGQASTAQTGPFLVGTQSVTFTDPGLAVPSVTMKVYYPATSAGANQPVANGLFPSLAFGHGFNLSFDDYEIICGHLASWGYIVMSPDVQNGFSVSHQEFARQLAACLNYMVNQGSVAQSPFYARTDTMTGVFGHSMGGGASGLLPAEFPGIDAVSGFAAAETNPSAIAALGGYSGPFQAISGNEDNVAPEVDNQVPMYNAATGSKQHISITGGAHCKFTDGSTICDLVSGGGSITREAQIYLSKKYVTAFFNFYLKQDQGALPFICGDSLQADASAGLITFATNYPCSVSVDEREFAGLRPWPNPTRDILSITGKGKIELVGLDGKTYFSKENDHESEMKLDVSRLPRGMYVLLVEGQKPSQVILQ